MLEAAATKSGAGLLTIWQNEARLFIVGREFGWDLGRHGRAGTTSWLNEAKGLG